MKDNNSFNTRTRSNPPPPPSLAQTNLSTTFDFSVNSPSSARRSTNTLSGTSEATDPYRIAGDQHSSKKRAYEKEDCDPTRVDSGSERSGKRIRREQSFDSDLAQALLFKAPVRRPYPKPEPQSTFSFSRAWQVAKDFFAVRPSPRTPLRSSTAFQRTGGPSPPRYSLSARLQDQRARFRRSRSHRASSQPVMAPVVRHFDQPIEPSASPTRPSLPTPPPSLASNPEPLSQLYTFSPPDPYVVVRQPNPSLSGLQADPTWSVETRHAFHKSQSGLRTSACIRSKLALVGDEDSVDDPRWQWQDPVPRSLTRRITNRNKREPDHAILARKMAFFQERAGFFERNGSEAYMEQLLAAGYTERHWYILNEIPQVYDEPHIPEPEEEDAEMEDLDDEDDYDYAEEEAEMEEWMRRVSKPPSPSRISLNPEYLSPTKGSTGLHRMERRTSSRPSKRSERASTPPPPSLTSPSTSDIVAQIQQFDVPQLGPDLASICTPPRPGMPTPDPLSPASPSSPFRALSIGEEDDHWTMVSPSEKSSINGSSSLLSSASRAWSAFATISSRPSLTSLLPHTSPIPTSAIPSFFSTPRSKTSESLHTTRPASLHDRLVAASDMTVSPKRKRSVDENEFSMGVGSPDSDAHKRRRR